MSQNIYLLNGRPIDWDKPPAQTTKVRWEKETIGGGAVVGSLRTIAHLDSMNTAAYHQFGEGLHIIQGPFNTTVAASAGTHDFDACVDWCIPGVGWWDQQKFGRVHGHGCWYRHAPAFSNHIHGFTLPPQAGTGRSDDFAEAGFTVGVYVDGGYSTRGRKVATSQIADYYNRALGLSGQHDPDSDKSWHPGRTTGGVKATIFNIGDYIRARRA